MTDAHPPHRWLLGTDRVQRLRMRQGLLALVLVLGCTLLGLWAALRAQTAAPLAVGWFVVALGGEAAMVLAIRCGWSRRLADPALTLPQIVFTLVLTAAIYPLVGEMRTAVFPVCLLILSFSTFQLRGRQMPALSALTLALLAAAIAANQALHAASSALAVELGHFVVMLMAVSGVTILAGRMAQIRRRLKQQRGELALALGRIEELAIRDALTGLYNRRHGEALLRQALARLARGDAPWHALLVDLDHFKRFNDTHGHAAGDAVLRAFAHIACDALRSTDAAIRWGGEEFVLLLAGSDWEVPLNRLRLAAVCASVRTDAGAELRFSFSAGLATAQAGETVEALLERADAALYRAKAGGRDRVEQA